MDPTLEAFLLSWPLDPWIVVPLLLTGAIYVRGWTQLRRRGAHRFGAVQLAAFLGGLAAVLLALASPLEPFAALLLQVHMAQHLLLMMVAPPLLWLGWPLLPLLRGLPEAVRRHWVAPFFRWGGLRSVLQRLTHPVTAWLLFVASTWIWHIPRLYEVALRSDGWHYVEHVCFFGTGLLFWWPVVQPFPSRPRWSRWLVLPYLLLADVQNTILSAFLAFSDRVLYPHYAGVPRLWGVSALNDQAAAGALMWVPGSLVYLVPLVWIGYGLLFGKSAMSGDGATSAKRQAGRIALPLAALSPPTRWDLLHVPLIGRFLKWRHARLTMQIPLFVLAGVMIADGLTGPQTASMNLAGVLPWIHWRGLVVLALLIAGNVFCMACPFLLPRTIARKWLPAHHAWPRWLRSKWLAVALLIVFLWAYEAFALWASPWWTAWIAVGYFVAAFVIDGWFRGAAFCKYVCPIGQFHFVQSLVSPLEIRVRDPAVCQQCVTKDCIRGRDGIPGCELQLFQPRKSGNMDCTFCLDCVHTCPHDNLGVEAVTPGVELWRDRPRSGVGRWSRRPDLAALVLVLVFGSFVNAAGMVGPVVGVQDRLAVALGLHPTLVYSTGFVLALLLVPAALVAAATALGRWWSGDPGCRIEVAACFAFALVPLGCGMWLTHYTFHFLTSAGTIIPVSQRFIADLGFSFLGEPAWGCGCCVAVASWLLRLEIVFLDLGLLLSLYAGYRIALERGTEYRKALPAFAPWAALMVLLFAVGIWIVFQPMEMRGTS